MPLPLAAAQPEAPLLVPPAPADATNDAAVEANGGPILPSEAAETRAVTRPGPLLVPPTFQPSSQTPTAPEIEPPPGTHRANPADEQTPHGGSTTKDSSFGERGDSGEATAPKRPNMGDGAAQPMASERATRFRPVVPPLQPQATPPAPDSDPDAGVEYQIDEAVRQATEGLAIDEDTRSRYRLWNGEWWFQTKGGGWKFYRGGAWRDFDPRNYAHPEYGIANARGDDPAAQPHVTLRPIGPQGYRLRYGEFSDGPPYAAVREDDRRRRDAARDFDDDDDAGPRGRRRDEILDGNPYSPWSGPPENGWAPGDQGGPWPPGSADFEPPPEERNRPRPLRGFLGRFFDRR